MLLWLVVGAYPWWSSPAPNWPGLGGNLLLFILLLLLGWHAFGPPIHA
jgi:hypothetical protein